MARDTEDTDKMNYLVLYPTSGYFKWCTEAMLTKIVLDEANSGNDVIFCKAEKMGGITTSYNIKWEEI